MAHCQGFRHFKVKMRYSHLIFKRKYIIVYGIKININAVKTLK